MGGTKAKTAGSDGSESSPSGKKKCSVCNEHKKPVLVIDNGKKKNCFGCVCGIFDKQGKKV